MADEVKIQIKEEHPVSVVETTVPTDKDPRQASSSSSVEPERAAEETERPASGAPATQDQQVRRILGIPSQYWVAEISGSKHRRPAATGP
jgi:hypothetical protein